MPSYCCRMSNDETFLQLPTRTGSFRAVVRVGDSVMEYSRAGSGQPVVLAGWSATCTGPHEAVRAALAQRFRLMVPESSPGPRDFSGWLRGFLDGLGLGRVTLVADDTFGLPAIGFALLDPDRVDRLVLLSCCATDALKLDAALTDPTRQSAVPVLILQQDQPVADLVQHMIDFLSGNPATPQ
jgi:pimeloyl-ACP methyl ester carboxylesterase